MGGQQEAEIYSYPCCYVMLGRPRRLLFLLAQSAHSILHPRSYPGHSQPCLSVVTCLAGESGEGILKYLPTSQQEDTRDARDLSERIALQGGDELLAFSWSPPSLLDSLCA